MVLGGQDKVPVIFGADADFLLDDFILQTIDHHKKNAQNTKIIKLSFYSLLAVQKSVDVLVHRHKEVYYQIVPFSKPIIQIRTKKFEKMFCIKKIALFSFIDQFSDSFKCWRS